MSIEERISEEKEMAIEQKGTKSKKMVIIHLLFSLLLVATLATPVLYLFTPCAKAIIEEGTTETIITTFLYGSDVTVRVYENGEISGFGRRNYTFFGVRDPIEAYVFMIVGFFFGIFTGSNYVITVDLEDKNPKRRFKKLVKFTTTYRVLTSYAFIGNLLGITGMLHFRNTIVALKEIFPELQLTYTYYIITILFFVSLVISTARLIYPKREFSYKKSKRPTEVIQAEATEIKEKTSGKEIENNDTNK
jgi:hypothetical protein